MNHALETEMKPNSRIVSQNIINDCQSDSFKNHETGNKNNEDDSLHKINLMRDIDWNEANLRETKLRDSQLQNDITVCQRDS